MTTVAVLDMSFWSQAVQAGVSDELLVDFTLLAPPEVAAEVMAFIPPPPPNAIRFLEGVRTGRIRVRGATVRQVTMFGAGERAALDLALEQTDALLLVTERRAYRYAQSRRLPVLHTPHYIALLAARNRLNRAEAEQALHAIRNQTAPEFISEALKLI